MPEFNFSRRTLESEPMPYPPPQRIATEVMDGRWRKTNDKPQWIEWLDVETVGDETFIHLRGGLAPSPADWGRVKCDTLIANAPNTYDATAGALIAHYDFDDMQVEVHANINLGLLVVATFVTFRTPGEYADRFTREFFWNDGGAA